MAEKVLSVFVDESGDFGPYAGHSPYYIVSLIFHDQSDDLSQQIFKLNESLCRLGLSDDYVIHTGPLIRREEEHVGSGFDLRHTLFYKLFFFCKNAPVQYRAFAIAKSKDEPPLKCEARLARELSVFLRDNREWLDRFDNIILYYDNGQHNLTRILNAVLSATLLNYDIRRIEPRNYKLSQVADMVCTLKLLELKSEAGKLSASELRFFGSKRDLNKQFLKPYQRKILGK